MINQKISLWHFHGHKNQIIISLVLQHWVKFFYMIFILKTGNWFLKNNYQKQKIHTRFDFITFYGPWNRNIFFLIDLLLNFHLHFLGLRNMYVINVQICYSITYHSIHRHFDFFTTFVCRLLRTITMTTVTMTRWRNNCNPKCYSCSSLWSTSLLTWPTTSQQLMGTNFCPKSWPPAGELWDIAL